MTTEHHAWDAITLPELQAFAREDSCLDAMVPSDLRQIVGRYGEAVDGLRRMLAWQDHLYQSSAQKDIDAAEAVIAKADGHTALVTIPDAPAQVPTDDQPDEIELGFNATTLKMLLLQRAAVDRQQTVQAMVEALAQLDVIRPVRAAAAYNHTLIGAHEHNRQNVADQIGRFLYANGVIEFAQRPDIAGGRGMTSLQGEVWVMIPKRLQGVDPDAPAGAEVVN